MNRDDLIARAKAKGMDDAKAAEVVDAYLASKGAAPPATPAPKPKSKPASASKPAPKSSAPAKKVDKPADDFEFKSSADAIEVERPPAPTSAPASAPSGQSGIRIVDAMLPGNRFGEIARSVTAPGGFYIDKTIAPAAQTMGDLRRMERDEMRDTESRAEAARRAEAAMKANPRTYGARDFVTAAPATPPKTMGPPPGVAAALSPADLRREDRKEIDKAPGIARDTMKKALMERFGTTPEKRAAIEGATDDAEIAAAYQRMLSAQ